MENIFTSPNGWLRRNDEFTGCTGAGTQCRLKVTYPELCTYTLTSFSAFPTKKTNHNQPANAPKQFHPVGGHVALYAPNGVHPLLIFRCDTWAAYWGVDGAALHGCTIQHICLLNAHTVVGFLSSPSKKSMFFSASTRDIAPSTDRSLRSFLATPKLSECNFDVTAITAASEGSIYCLDKAGVLRECFITLKSKSEEFGTIANFSVLHESSKAAKPNASATSHIVRCTNGNGVVIFDDKSNVATLAYSKRVKAQTITLGKTSTRITFAAFCGTHHLCFGLDDGQGCYSLCFAALVESGKNDPPEVILAEPVAIDIKPVSCFFEEELERVTIVCLHASATLKKCLSFADGPFTARDFQRAPWLRLSSSVDADLESVFQSDTVESFLSGQQQPQERPLTLNYALTSKGADDKWEVTGFNVHVAPTIHNRLLKQWHNADAGLVLVLEGAVPISRFLQWNPGHLRRAIKKTSSNTIRSSFRHLIGHDGSVAPQRRISAFPDIAFAGTEFVLQIIGLAPLLGSPLSTSDIQYMVRLLRASREVGHDLNAVVKRISLLMTSTLQRRSISGLLGHTPQDTDGDAPAHQFFGMQQMEKNSAFHTRYMMNSWFIELEDRRAQYASINQSADAYLTEAGVADAFPDGVEDWDRLGRLPHHSKFLSVFEQDLLQ